jgi:hypothetical protein
VRKIHHYGIRAICDAITDDRKSEPEFYDKLECLELVMTDRAPYRDTARFFQLIAETPAETHCQGPVPGAVGDGCVIGNQRRDMSRRAIYRMRLRHWATTSSSLDLPAMNSRQPAHPTRANPSNPE